MARPTKQGIDYFPLDVGFLRDIKVRKITKACGLSSISILICLLSNVYRDDGYYLKWDNDQAFLVADDVGTSEDAVLEVVNKAVQVGFFDEHMWNEYKILTSRGIQERFFSAVSKRKKVFYRREFMLISVSSVNNLVSSFNNPVNDVHNPQSKVKESKVKESKGEGIDKQIPIPKLSPADMKKLEEEFVQLAGGISTIQYAKLKELLQLHSLDRVLEAIHIAKDRDKRKLSYVEGILRSWERDGYDGDQKSKTVSPGIDRTNAKECGKDWSDIPESL